MYSATTLGIQVKVEPAYLPDASEPEENNYLWAYTVEIVNQRDGRVQLRTRSWTITDERGHVEHVNGPGVIGEQPIINPGDSFTYTSGCPLKTPSGVMVGSYQMEDENGAAFDVEIPAFSLDLPDSRPVIN